MAKLIWILAAMFATAACALAFVVTHEERFAFYSAFCGLSGLIFIQDRQLDRLKDRVEELEDAHSRRWEP